MAQFCVLRTNGGSHLKLPMGLSAKSRECRRISHVVQGEIRVHNLVGIGVHGKVQFSPAAEFF